MRFKSKVDIWFYLAALLLLAGAVLLRLAAGYTRVGFFYTLSFLGWLALLLVLLPSRVNTFYLLDKDGVYIQSGFLFKTHIAYGDILSITPARNYLPAPALSVNRLEIQYNKLNGRGLLYISPPDRESFMRGLNQVDC